MKKQYRILFVPYASPTEGWVSEITCDTRKEAVAYGKSICAGFQLGYLVIPPVK